MSGNVKAALIIRLSIICATGLYLFSRRTSSVFGPRKNPLLLFGLLKMPLRRIGSPKRSAREIKSDPLPTG